MAHVLHRTSKQYLESVNTPDYPTVDWIRGPDLSAVTGFASKYWIVNGDVVTLMSPAQRATVDSDEAAAIAAANAAAITAERTWLQLTSTATAPIGTGSGTVAPGDDPRFWTYAVAGDFTTSSSSAVDVTGLAFTPAANTRYEFEAGLLTRTATATVGPRPGVGWPGGMTDGVASINQTSAAATIVGQYGNISGAVLAPVGGVPTTTGSWPATIRGILISGASPTGTLRIQLASETNGTNVTVRAGSFLKYRAF